MHYKTTAVQDTLKWNSHNIIKHPQFKVTIMYTVLLSQEFNISITTHYQHVRSRSYTVPSSSGLRLSRDAEVFIKTLPWIKARRFRKSLNFYPCLLSSEADTLESLVNSYVAWLYWLEDKVERHTKKHQEENDGNYDGSARLRHYGFGISRTNEYTNLLHKLYDFTYRNLGLYAWK